MSQRGFTALWFRPLSSSTAWIRRGKASRSAGYGIVLDEKTMAAHSLAGKPAPTDMLIDVGRLEREYYDHKPDVGDPRQLVNFSTSGHRGTTGDGTFTEAHILAITQAICEYRRGKGIDGPLFMG